MLDPETAGIVAASAASGLPTMDQMTPDQAKAAYRQGRVILAMPDLANVEKRDLEASGPAGAIPIRLYRPKNKGEAVLPVLVFYHGGGFTVGDLDTHDGACQALCDESGAAVVSVQYRVAPEHKFPEPLDDAYAALEWVAAHGAELKVDPGRLAVGGDSAGACLAAVVALQARDRKGPAIRWQMLIYPTTDHHHDRPSHARLGKGYVLTTELLYYFRGLHLRTLADIEDWRASPLLAPDHSNLPPAWILIAGYDPLSDEGEAYAQALRDAGVPAELVSFPGQIHGFITMGKYIPQARTALTQAAQALAAAVS